MLHGGKMKFSYIERTLETVYDATIVEMDGGILAIAEPLSITVTHDLYLVASVNGVVFLNIPFKSVFACVRYLIRNSTEIYKSALRNVNHV